MEQAEKARPFSFSPSQGVRSFCHSFECLKNHPQDQLLHMFLKKVLNYFRSGPPDWKTHFLNSFQPLKFLTTPPFLNQPNPPSPTNALILSPSHLRNRPPPPLTTSLGSQITPMKTFMMRTEKKSTATRIKLNSYADRVESSRQEECGGSCSEGSDW